MLFDTDSHKRGDEVSETSCADGRPLVMRAGPAVGLEAVSDWNIVTSRLLNDTIQ